MARDAHAVRLPKCPQCGGKLLIVCSKCGNANLDEAIEALVGRIRAGIESEGKIDRKELERQLREANFIIAKQRTDIATLQSSMASPYIKGKFQQLSICENLEEAFSNEHIEIISDGKRGADVLICFGFGTTDESKVLIESKNAIRWRADWLPKLHKDKIETKADLGILDHKSL